MPQHTFQPPTGTRDLYPIEAARRRFITEAWRRVSINHGFEEIDGPTFEHLDLYKVKSGEGIVSELFSFTRAGGEKDYALRPEFTPTLARMYAAKAASLPKPTKWFTAGPFFRAERPQRGRLREFLQWNCDVIGLALPEQVSELDLLRAKAQADADVIECATVFFRDLGLSSSSLRIRISDRAVIASVLKEHGVLEHRVVEALQLMDKRAKMVPHEFEVQFEAVACGLQEFDKDLELAESLIATGTPWAEFGGSDSPTVTHNYRPLVLLFEELRNRGLADWCTVDLSIARGLAYYTGMVFEVIVDGERAVAGGGRYDNLIELFGGPPTPAVGFGMGDVVLSLVLQDKGLMPSDDELMGIAGQNPDVFVISNGTPEADAALPRVLSDLRRADTPLASRPPRLNAGLHVRRSYKTTKNVGKLLQEAVKSRARIAVIVENAGEATIKDLKSGVQDQGRTPLAALAQEIPKRLAN